MNTARKLYWYLLFFAIAIYIIGNAVLQSQILIKIGGIEHQLAHLSLE